MFGTNKECWWYVVHMIYFVHVHQASSLTVDMSNRKPILPFAVWFFKDKTDCFRTDRAHTSMCTCVCTALKDHQSTCLLTLVAFQPNDTPAYTGKSMEIGLPWIINLNRYPKHHFRLRTLQYHFNRQCARSISLSLTVDALYLMHSRVCIPDGHDDCTSSFVRFILIDEEMRLHVCTLDRFKKSISQLQFRSLFSMTSVTGAADIEP